MTENLFDQIPGKAVVSRFDRRMRRKQAAASHDFYVRFHRNRILAKTHLFLEERQREECGMTFVHVIAVQVFQSNMAEQTNAPDAQQNFLTDPVVLVAAVELHGDNKSGHAMNVAAPGPYMHIAILDTNREGSLHRLQHGFRYPGIGLFGLIPFRIQALAEISFSMQQRDRDHWQFEIRRGSKHVPS